MNKLIKSALAGLVLMTAGANLAHAESEASIVSTNNSSNSVWVTYYNVTKNHLGSAVCVKANQTFTSTFDWTYVTQSEGGVYLRFEYKQDTNCGGKTIYDSGYGGMYQMPALGHTLTVNIPKR